MKRYLPLAVVTVALLSAGCISSSQLGIPSNFAKSPVFETKAVWRTAVLPPTGSVPGLSQGQVIYDYAGMALLRTGRFTVVDRSAVDQILREQEFSYSGVVDQATAVQLGRLLGSEAVMMVSITSVSHDEFWSDTPEQRDAELHVKIISVETSEILYTAVGQGSDFDGADGALRSALEMALMGIGNQGGIR
ncbi:MAG: CsgG/HfaB family protein [Candidatus Fermentibacteraceae bacterium]